VTDPVHLVPEDLLDIMQCPSCGGTLQEITDPPALQCTGCRLRYPVEDGIPVMLIEEATRPDGD